MALKKNAKHDNVKRLASQKVLLPTLKEQQRYVVYAVKSSGRTFGADFRLIHEQIVSQCGLMLGMFDGAKAGLMSVKYDAEKRKGIIRVNNKYVDKLKLCLGLIKEIDMKRNTEGFEKIQVAIDCVFVSGMLNKAESFMND
jgi:RNase P/RNase MRP subunit POP5